MAGFAQATARLCVLANHHQEFIFFCRKPFINKFSYQPRERPGADCFGGGAGLRRHCTMAAVAGRSGPWLPGARYGNLCMPAFRLSLRTAVTAPFIAVFVVTAGLL